MRARRAHLVRFGELLLRAIVVLALGWPWTIAHALKSDAEQPINIRARNVDLNEKTGVSVYQGNVVLTQGSLRLEADRVEVLLRDRRTDLVRAWGKPVRLRTRTDAGDEIQASAARAEYYATGRRIDLHGSVVLRRNDDVFNGGTVQYFMDAQTFNAASDKGGRVSAVIQPAPPEPRR